MSTITGSGSPSDTSRTSGTNTARLTIIEVPEAVATSPADWARQHGAEMFGVVADRGAVVIRGLAITAAVHLAEVARALGIEPMAERERFASRRPLADGVHSSSEWPADEPMCMHHELSYAYAVPSYLLFGCLRAPSWGGLTRVADSQEVLRALPPGLVAGFERKGWLLTRTYREIGVSLTESFGTDDRSVIDAYCETAGLEREWLPDGSLRTRQRRPALRHHPRTGVPVWFNQVAFLNERTLDPAVREYLVDVYGPESLPFTTAYGDGTPVDGATVEILNAAYREAAAGEAWRAGDLLLVDNLRMAHGRDPYRGEREIAVVMGNSVTF